MIRSTSSLVSVSSSFWLLCRFLSSVSCLLCHFLSSVSCPITLPDRCVLFSVVPPLLLLLSVYIHRTCLCFVRLAVFCIVLCFVFSVLLLSYLCCVL
ncbi:hypothetical protein CPB85DRAFT_1317706 [Mucidula mucida]|nr:hypothetical protein CPB85DRAFT_1317706 [Mucidula mucida]